MNSGRIAFAVPFGAALGPASAADLLAIYRDSQVSDPVYQSARATYTATIEKVPQARSAYLPLIAGSASAFRNDIDREIAGSIGYNTTVYAITLSQPIFRMQSWIAIDQAKQQVIQAEATLAGAQQDLILRVAQAYFDVLLAQDNVALSDYEIFVQEIGRQRAGHLPTLDLTGNFARASNPQSAVPGAVGAISNAGVIGLQLSVPIYSGGLIQSRVREAVANRDRAQQDLDNTQRGVAQAVRTNFFNVTSGIAQVRALEQALASTQSQLDSTILGRDVGVRTSVDVLNAQQSVFQTRRDLQQARYNFLMSNLRLKAAAGILTETDLEDVNRTLARG